MNKKKLIKKSEQKMFKVYAGLKYEFGGANYLGEFSFKTKDDALNYAKKEATDLFIAYVNTPDIDATISVDKLMELGFNVEQATKIWFSNQERYIDFSVA